MWRPFSSGVAVLGLNPLVWKIVCKYLMYRWAEEIVSVQPIGHEGPLWNEYVKFCKSMRVDVET